MAASLSNLKEKIAVIGAGAWGTVIAFLLAKNGHDVHVWARREAQASAMQQQRVNRDYLPDLILPENIQISSSLAQVCRDALAAFFVIPSKGLRAVMAQLPAVPQLISCSKGIEIGSFLRFSQILAEYQPHAALAALSGPNLAKEIAQGLPASATLASEDDTFVAQAQRWLHSSAFRVYTSNDLVGVELGGALKNVIALAAGMCEGLQLGDNARASIITRGLSEMVRLGQHMGADATTFYGLAGLGDMIATCSSPLSRNHRAGLLISQGANLESLEQSRMTTEGIPTCRAVLHYAQKYQLQVPITEQVYHVIYDGKAPRAAIRDLMERASKEE